MRSFLLLCSIAVLLFIGGCTDAKIASHNLSKAAEQFELERRIVFYNGITSEYILVITGLCSVDERHDRLSVTCKTDNDEYKKHYLGLSDNVTYFSEQIQAAAVGVYNYRVVFKPQAVVPNIDIQIE